MNTSIQYDHNYFYHYENPYAVLKNVFWYKITIEYRK